MRMSANDRTTKGLMERFEKIFSKKSLMSVRQKIFSISQMEYDFAIKKKKRFNIFSMVEINYFKDYTNL